MPTLNWIGKDKVINHHLDVPFRMLERKYSFDCENGQTENDNNSENMIIHGDNLEALKALLPKFESKVSCIFIDPPYNTGEEKWIYNDNMNAPQLKAWIGEIVGTESEDLTRHDKWLCMMYPRLRILQKLLAEDGIIAVSIDDNEVFNLGCIMNEIFGSKNRLACAPWLAEPSGGKEKTKIRNGHEYLLIYTNGSIESLSKEEKSSGELNLRDENGNYRKGRELRKWGGNSRRADRPNQWYPLLSPSGETVFPYKNDGTEGHWRWGREQKMRIIVDNPNAAHWEYCNYDEGIVVNGETGRWVPFEKIRDKKKSIGWSSWLDKYGYNSDATAELKKIFGTKIFDTPKPLALIEWIVSLYDGRENPIILDSFAGSGTTAHAVLKLNQQDEENRNFILVEMEDYADSITAERVKRAIRGYSDIAGLGGTFSFYELGKPLFESDTTLNDSIDTEEIRKYIWFMETRSNYEKPRTQTMNEFYLGSFSDTAYYFYYDRTQRTALTYEFLATITKKSTSYVIYADTCMIDESDLVRLGIIFKKIPRDISKL